MRTILHEVSEAFSKVLKSKGEIKAGLLQACVPVNSLIEVDNQS